MEFRASRNECSSLDLGNLVEYRGILENVLSLTDLHSLVWNDRSHEDIRVEVVVITFLSYKIIIIMIGRFSSITRRPSVEAVVKQRMNCAVPNRISFRVVLRSELF